MTNDDERYKKIGKAAVDATRKMMKTLPDNAKLIEGKQVLSGKDAKKKFEADDDFAAKQTERLIGLAADLTKRKKIK